MPPSRIKVFRSVSFPEKSSPGETAISFDTLKSWFQNGKILGQLFRYQEAVLHTYRLGTLTKPFVTQLSLKLLARGNCRLEDEKGDSLQVSWRGVMSLALRYLGDFFKRGEALRQVQRDVEALEKESFSKKRPLLNLEDRPLYLRTDLAFGVTAGGSVGHIAGVLNHLGFFSGPPLFFSSSEIPTVRKDIQTQIIALPQEFLDFREIPSFRYNGAFVRGVSAGIEGQRLSFVYQRYSLNDYSGIQLAREKNIPLVLEFNGPEVWVSRHWGKRLKYEDLSERIELIDLKAADLVVVVSNALEEGLKARGIAEDQILVNPNGVDTDQYSPQVDGSQVREKYGFQGKTVLGFIGTFGKWHGAEVLAQAFGEWANEIPQVRNQVRLLMIGDGITLPKVKEILGKYGVLDLCFFTGTIPQSEGPSYLSACDIFVASHVPNPDGTPFFGSPTKLFEYMAMGKGIVASNLDQIGEVLKHNETAWMVKPGDKDSLKEGLKILAGDPALRERLGRAARTLCLAMYTWKEHTRRIIEKLKERCG